MERGVSICMSILSAVLLQRYDNTFILSAVSGANISGPFEELAPTYEISWYPTVFQSGGDGSLSATYVPSNPNINQEAISANPVRMSDSISFPWNTPQLVSTGAAYISGELFTDAETYYVAVCGEDLYGVPAEILPRVPTLLIGEYDVSDRVPVTAVLVESQTNAVYHLPVEYSASWLATPQTNIAATDINTASVVTLDGALSGTPDVSSVYVSANNPNTYVIDFNLQPAWRTPAQFIYSNAYDVRFNFNESTASEFQVSGIGYATRGIGPESIPTFDTLQWRVSPSESVVLENVNGVSLPLTNGYTAAVSPTAASVVELTVPVLTETYSLGISAQGATSSWYDLLYRPELALEDDSSLTARYTPIDTISNPNTYLLEAFGVFDPTGVNVPHNFRTGQLIGWSVSANPPSLNSSIVATRDNGLPYSFIPLTGVSPGLFEAAGVVENLHLDITPRAWDGLGSIDFDTYAFTVSALSGTSDFITADPIVLQVQQTIPNTIFQPIFSINNELTSTLNVYREHVDPYTLTIRNSSTLPAGITNSTFEIQIGSFAPIVTSHTFTSITTTISTPGPQTLPVTMSGTLLVNTWGTSATKVTNEYNLHLVDEIPVAEFVVYPTYKWDAINQEFDLITSDPITLTEGPSAFGYCHTEVFYLSAPPQAGTTYIWNISGANNIANTSSSVIAPIQGVAGSVHPITLQLVTSALPVNMSPYYYDDVTGALSVYSNFASSVPVGDVDWRLAGDIIIEPVSAPNTLVITSNRLDIGADIDLGVLTTNTTVPTASPATRGDNTSYDWSISTASWQATATTTSSQYSVEFTPSISPTADYEIPYFSSTTVTVDVTGSIDLVSKDPSAVNDFCSDTFNVSADTIALTAWPIDPVIYTSNIYVLSGDSVIYENLVPTGPYHSGFQWTDRDITTTVATNAPYTTAYTTPGTYDVTLTTMYSSIEQGIIEQSRSFDDAVTVVSEFATFDPRIIRIVDSTVLELPYSLADVKAPHNEWLIADNINAVFNKLEANVQYLYSMAQVYGGAPTGYRGWLGTQQVTDDMQLSNWWINLPVIDYNYTDPSVSVSGKFTNLRDIKSVAVPGVGSNILIASNTTAVQILSSDFNATEITSLSSFGVDDPFVNIVSVEVDNNFGTDNRIYILDKTRHLVVVYKYSFSLDSWQLLYSWGGVGGSRVKNKYKAPTDLRIGPSNDLWIVDSGNHVIKRYSRTGSWKQTYTSPLLATKTLQSCTFNDAGNLVVLCSDCFVEFNSSGSSATMYTIPEISGTMNRIRTNADGGYFYVTTSSACYKITQDYRYFSEFGSDLGVQYTSVYHDQHRNVLLATPTALINYVDKLDIISLMLDIKASLWPISAMYIQPDEFVQDWVYTKSFQRYFDNLRAIHGSVLGKFDYTTSAGVRTPIVRNFTPYEYKSLESSKADIFFGINELVTADVFNRNIEKLYRCQEIILDLLS